MSIIVNDVVTLMEELAPIKYAEPWDNCGLLVGDKNHHIEKILIALDPTASVIEEAIGKKVDLIITHHPLMISKINKITSANDEGSKIIKLIKNDIALYSAHTNLDLAKGGLEDNLAKKIGLKTCQIMEVKHVTQAGVSLGYGRMGMLEKTLSLIELAKKIKYDLDIDYLQIVGREDKKINKIAIACGSGTSQLDTAIRLGADVLITGDVKYHTASHAQDSDICLIDASHYGTEKLVIGLLSDYLKCHLKDIEIIQDELIRNPIKKME